MTSNQSNADSHGFDAGFCSGPEAKLRTTIRRALLSLAALLPLAACGPDRPETGGGRAPPAAAIVEPDARCKLAPNQTNKGLRLDCRVTGRVPDRLIDPFDKSNSRCVLASLALSRQTVDVPVTVLIVESTGDIMGLDTTIRRGSHRGRLAKSWPNCQGTIPPEARLVTRFSGRHLVRLDTSGARACVFQSGLELTGLNQTATAGPRVNTETVTRPYVQEGLERTLDLELAKVVNRALKPDADISARRFVDAAGRCPGNWRPS